MDPNTGEQTIRKTGEPPGQLDSPDNPVIPLCTPSPRQYVNNRR